MTSTFYFYDTETSGIRPSQARIMQFAGRRTTLDLEPIGDPDDILIKLTPDILPEPDAILVHGITPQKTISEGITEADFARYFIQNIAVPGTIFVGFNNVRFDDEFIRYLLYRNFHEPYEWQWKDNRSRWDILDVIRMTRALRPDGIKWPTDKDGNPTVRLELMTKTNNINHLNAHTALADVDATIRVAELVKKAQPKMFDYLLAMRAKGSVKELVESGAPFVYTSGKYPGSHLKTTLAYMLFKHPRRDAAIVYDLRADPTSLLELSVSELSARWRAKKDDNIERLPIKTLQYNRCPAVAVESVLDIAGTSERIAVDRRKAHEHAAILRANPEFTAKIAEALGMLEQAQEAQQTTMLPTGVDEQLYDGFWSDYDRHMLQTVRQHPPATLQELANRLKSKRMLKLLPLYKARNFATFLTPEEHDAWEVYRQEKLFMNDQEGPYGRFMQRMSILLQQRQDKNDKYLLAELQLYVESIFPTTD